MAAKKRKLKIAMFCTNEWPTPPPENTFYAPLWIANYIAEGLAKKGHQVYPTNPHYRCQKVLK